MNITNVSPRRVNVHLSVEFLRDAANERAIIAAPLSAAERQRSIYRARHFIRFAGECRREARALGVFLP